MRTRAIVVLAALGAGNAPGVLAQALRAAPRPISAPAVQDTVHAPLLRRAWVRPVGSLLVPGAGQLAAGQSRGLVYLATELWVVSRAIANGRRGRQGAGQFRTLMYDVARRQFTAQRQDGPWDYYEAAEKFVESGVFDANPGGTFAPESDTTTFNGSLWQLARRTFFVNPDAPPPASSAPYQAAERFYKVHAVGDGFRWSWRGARLEQGLYRDEIRASDDALRARTNYLGVLVVNHLASAIDALISLRLGGRRGAVPTLGIPPGGDGVVLAWRREFRIH